MTQFYQITLQSAIADYQLGKLTTFGLVDYYIRIKFAPGWKISIDPRKAIQELGITIHQFRRAIAKIRETVFITLKTTTQLVGEMPAEKPVISIPLDGTANVNRVTPRVNQVTNGVNHVTPNAQSDPQTPNKTNASSDSPDIRSNIDQISLSELDQISAEEREKFLEFAWKKVDELPKRPTLPKKWIAANLSDLYSEWKKSSAPVTRQAAKEKQFAEWYDLMRQLGHVTGQKVENGVQLVKDVCGAWSEYESEAKYYSLDYLRKCVAGR